MPFRAETPFLLLNADARDAIDDIVSMPFRAETPFLRCTMTANGIEIKVVSMPFRAETPFLPFPDFVKLPKKESYQCPLGLVLHFYKKKHF